MLATSTRPIRSAALRPQRLASAKTTRTATTATRIGQRSSSSSSSIGSAWRMSTSTSTSSKAAARTHTPRTQQIRTATNEARVGATTSSNAQSGANLGQTTDTGRKSASRSSSNNNNNNVGSSSSSSSSKSGNAAAGETLTWNRFLGLRKTRRRLGLVASVASAAAATAVGANLLMAYDLDTVGAATLGMDSIFVMGLGVVASGGVGWLAGPAVGDAVFKVMYRRIGAQIAQKESAFYQRIKKFRVDPTSSSLNNPVPDYYGEKIGSVGDYRRWLKDQRAFNLKTSGRARGAAAGRVALRKKGE